MPDLTFDNYKSVPVYNDDGSIAYYQQQMVFKETEEEGPENGQ